MDKSLSDRASEAAPPCSLTDSRGIQLNSISHGFSSSNKSVGDSILDISYRHCDPCSKKARDRFEGPWPSAALSVLWYLAIQSNQVPFPYGWVQTQNLLAASVFGRGSDEVILTKPPYLWINILRTKHQRFLSLKTPLKCIINQISLIWNIGETTKPTWKRLMQLFF